MCGIIIEQRVSPGSFAEAGHHRSFNFENHLDVSRLLEQRMIRMLRTCVLGAGARGERLGFGHQEGARGV